MSGAVWQNTCGYRKLKTASVWRIARKLDVGNKTGAVQIQWSSQAIAQTAPDIGNILRISTHRTETLTLAQSPHGGPQPA